jgi:myosin heavy subunit
MDLYNPASSGTPDGEPIKLPVSSVTETKELKEQRNLPEREKSNLMSELNKLKKKVSEAEEERKTLTQQMKTLTEKNTTLEAEVESHKLEIEELKEKIVELKRELKSKDDDIESLEARITNLEEEGRRDKSDQDTLYISQAGYQFEQAICTYVLPDVFENDQHATIESLLEYLHNQNKLPEKISDPSSKLSKGREQWDKVCVHLNLPTSERVGDFTQWGLHRSSTPDIIKAICILKKMRREIAHPRPISLKLVGEKLPAVKDKMPEWQFNLIERFVASVQESIEKSGSKMYSEHFQLD